MLYANVWTYKEIIINYGQKNSFNNSRNYNMNLCSNSEGSTEGLLCLCLDRAEALSHGACLTSVCRVHHEYSWCPQLLEARRAGQRIIPISR